MKLNVTVPLLMLSLSAAMAAPLAAEERNTSSEGNFVPHLDLNSVMPLLADQPQSDWRKQYDEAKARKSGGKTKMLLGLAMDGAGIATAYLAADHCVNNIFNNVVTDCSGSSSMMLLGGLIAAGGGITFIWGLVEYIDANGDVKTLEAQRPAGDRTGISIGDHQEVALSLGRRSSVAYRVSW